jgi:hypothetical protein
MHNLFDVVAAHILLHLSVSLVPQQWAIGRLEIRRGGSTLALPREGESPASTSTRVSFDVVVTIAMSKALIIFFWDLGAYTSLSKAVSLHRAPVRNSASNHDDIRSSSSVEGIEERIML